MPRKNGKLLILSYIHSSICFGNNDGNAKYQKKICTNRGIFLNTSTYMVPKYRSGLLDDTRKTLTSIPVQNAKNHANAESISVVLMPLKKRAPYGCRHMMPQSKL